MKGILEWHRKVPLDVRIEAMPVDSCLGESGRVDWVRPHLLLQVLLILLVLLQGGLHCVHPQGYQVAFHPGEQVVRHNFRLGLRQFNYC